jgi:hypothetical protein
MTGEQACCRDDTKFETKTEIILFTLSILLHWCPAIATVKRAKSTLETLVSALSSGTLAFQ